MRRAPGTVLQSGSRPPLIDRSLPATILLGAPLVLLTCASLVGNVLAPHLLATNALLLVVLAPRTIYLAVAAAQAPWAAFVAVAFLRLCAADPSHFYLGRLHGRRLYVRAPGLLVRLWERLGVALVALVPNGKVLLLAGASALPHRRVASAAAAGTLAQVVVVLAAGRAVAGPGQAFAEALAANATVIALVAAVVTLVLLAAARWLPADRWGRPWGVTRPCGRPAR